MCRHETYGVFRDRLQRQSMNAQPKKVFEIAVAMAVLVFQSISARSDTIYVWSDDGTIKQFATNGVGSVLASNISGWNGPVGLALDNAGNLYSGCPGNSTVTKFATNGTVVSVVGLDSVSGLAFDSTGILYATIPNYAEILKDYSYTDYSQSHLSYPISLAFDGEGNIFVANSVPPFFYPWNPINTIVKFSPNLAYLGDFATDLNEPWGLAFDRAGNLYVSNSGTNGDWKNTIVKYTPNGSDSIFASIGLNNPRGLAFDSAGSLYVANAGNGTVKKFTPDGGSSTFASGLNYPTSIAIHPGLKVWPSPITLTNPTMLPGGAFQFTFSNTPFKTNTVLTTTNPGLPLTNWTVLDGVTEGPPGQFQFTDPQATNNSQRFYRVRAN
jgi:sugar lactone lactonase YvrE